MPIIQFHCCRSGYLLSRIKILRECASGCSIAAGLLTSTDVDTTVLALLLLTLLPFFTAERTSRSASHCYF
jgi:hypothetical protein